MEIDARETWYKRYKRKLKKKMLDLFGNQCNQCEEKDIKKLQFAHKIGWRLGYGDNRGSKNRLLEVQRNPERFLLLCKDCHLKYDRENPLTEDERLPF